LNFFRSNGTFTRLISILSLNLRITPKHIIMNKLYKLMLLSALFGFGWQSTAMACTGGTNAGSITTTGNWATQNVTVGQYYEFEGQAGEYYYFSFCSTNGGSASWDTQISILNSGGGQVAYNDDYCGLQSYLGWYCSTAGTYRVLTSQYYCNNTSGSSGTLAFFGPPPPFANDAGISNIISPSLPKCTSDSSAITVEVQNLGNDTLNTCNILWAVNSGSSTTYSFSGSIAPGDVDTVTILAAYLFTNNDDLDVWSELPNNVPDSFNANDLSEVTLVNGLSGTYAIPGDYTTITAAASDLSTYGVCDTVIFNIAAGTYNEQVTFGEIVGASEDATVTFQSATGNPNDVLITYAATNSANNWVVNFGGGDYITFREVMMTATGGYYGNVVAFSGQSNHITLEGNRLKGISGTSTNYQAVINMGTASDDFTLTDNRIEKGSCWFYSTSGNTASKKHNLVIEDNEMSSQSYYGAYIYYFDGVEFNGNTIKNDSAFQYGYGYYGMGYWYYVDNFNITNNYVGASTGNGWYYAMYMYQCVGSSNPRSLIANNCITTGNTTSSTAYYALYMSQSGLVDIYNNSFTRSGNNNSYCGYIYQGGAINLKNNSFANLGSGYALYMNGGFTINESDNNNYYNTGGSITYWGNSVYQTVEAMSEGSGQDANSVSTDPNWQDLFTCVTCSDTLSDAGTPLASVPSDISGNTRSPQTPDIGATEFVNANSFSLGADDTLCGNELLLEAGPAQSVAWGVSENGGATQTYTTTSITLNNSGGAPSEFEVSVVLSTEFCGNATDDVVIRLVSDATLDSSMHVCADDVATLTPGGGTGATYAWSTGATTATIDADAIGLYTVTKMEDGCESSAETAVTKSVAVEIADVEGCEDDAPITVDATIPDGSSYAWSGGSAQTSAANDFSTSGAYSVTATDIHGCVSTSDFDLMVLGAPDAAIDYVGTAGPAYLFSSANTTNTSANTTYLWTFNSIDTSTAANPSYVFPWNGPPTTYPVTLVVDNGCGESLKAIDITVVVGVDELETKAFEVYPNPATDNFFIAAGSDFNTLDVTIIDNAGRSVYSQSYNGQQVIEVNTSDLASGAYLIKMVSESSSEVQTLIVQ
jgi:hypothetical protein